MSKIFGIPTTTPINPAIVAGGCNASAKIENGVLAVQVVNPTATVENNILCIK